jgi:hypothetical protein
MLHCIVPSLDRFKMDTGSIPIVIGLIAMMCSPFINGPIRGSWLSKVIPSGLGAEIGCVHAGVHLFTRRHKFCFVTGTYSQR